MKIKATGRESHHSNPNRRTEQSFSPRFQAGLHSGVQFRSGNNGGQTSPYVETTLRYELAPLGGYGLSRGGMGGRLGGTKSNG